MASCWIHTSGSRPDHYLQHHSRFRPANHRLRRHLHHQECNGGRTEIAYNTVYNGITPGYGGSGLYLDNNSAGFVVDHNITYNVNTAMKMNMTSLGETIVNNTLDATQFSVNKTWGAYDWSGSIVQNNIFIRPVQFGLNASISHNATIGGGGVVNLAKRDYQLAAGSSAIGAAGAMAPYATSRRAGAARTTITLAYGSGHVFTDGGDWVAAR